MDTLQTKTQTLARKKGSGLIFAVVLMFVILGMVITLSSITILETKMSQKTKSSIGAFYNSESGVEWALNKIATTTASNVIGAFPEFSGGKAPCPTSDCEVYLLDKDGIVITNNLATIEEVKAVRSVGTQNTGEVTQRAIEAAVAATGNFVYTEFGNSTCSDGTEIYSGYATVPSVFRGTTDGLSTGGSTICVKGSKFGSTHE